MAAGLEFGRCQGNFRPGGWRLVGVNAGGLERILVEVEDRGRTVEREAQHLAVRRRVIAGHGRNINRGVKLVTGVRHHLADRHDGALAGHHGGGADLEDLQDVGRIAGAKRRNRRRHGFGIATLVRGDYLVLFLAGIEFLGQVVNPLAIDGSHRMPPLNFGLGLGRHGESRCKGNGSNLEVHIAS